MKKGGRNECWVYRRTKIRPTGSRQCEIYDNLEGHDEWLTYPELREIGGLEKRNFYAVIQRMINAGSLEKRPIWLHKILTEGTEVVVYNSTRDVAYVAHAEIHEGNVVFVIPFKCPDRAISCIRNFVEG